MGTKMGGSVGAIFGGLTGIYAAVVHRNFLLFPVSLVSRLKEVFFSNESGWRWSEFRVLLRMRDASSVR